MLREDHDQDAARLVKLYEAREAVAREMAEAARAGDLLTGRHASDVLEADDALTAACSDFGRKHYPRRGEVFVAGYTAPGVYVRSRGGRVVRNVYQAKP